MRISKLDPDTPYFLRVMYKSDNVASPGTLTLNLGGTSESVSMSQSGDWKELFVAADKDTWPHIFNEDGFGIDIQLVSTRAGEILYIDDVIFAPYTLIDGTYWVIRGNAATHTPWKLGDTLEFTDTGGAPSEGKVQYWLSRTGLGYLPHTTTGATFTDP